AYLASALRFSNTKGRFPLSRMFANTKTDHLGKVKLSSAASPVPGTDTNTNRRPVHPLRHSRKKCRLSTSGSKMDAYSFIRNPTRREHAQSRRSSKGGVTRSKRESVRVRLGPWRQALHD